MWLASWMMAQLVVHPFIRGRRTGRSDCLAVSGCMSGRRAEGGER